MLDEMNDSELRASLRTTASTWPSVRAFYSALMQEPAWQAVGAAMLRVVEALASDANAKVLWPTTSHEVLCLARTPVFEWGLEMLQVKHDSEGYTVIQLSRAAADVQGRAFTLAAGVPLEAAVAEIRRWVTEH
jgi:hypothetical protein